MRVAPRQPKTFQRCSLIQPGSRYDHGEFQAAANGILPSANFSNQGSRLVAPGTPFNGEPLTGGNGGVPGSIMSFPIFICPSQCFVAVSMATCPSGSG